MPIPPLPRFAICFVVGCVALAAACGDDEVSDEDLIEKFIEEVTGDVDGTYVPRCLGYVDMAAYPLDVKVPHHGGVYNAERGPKLIKRFEQAISRRFMGSELKRRSAKYEIEGDTAEVKLALLSAVGPLRVEVTLKKASEGVWKVSRVHVDPRF